MDKVKEMQDGLKTAFIDNTYNSNLAYRPEFLSNDYKQGKKVLASLEQELSNCDEFCISVAFIKQSGIEPLLMTLKELENKNIQGKILTTDYLTFSEPKALEKLAGLKNIELKMFRTAGKNEGFHTKGYIFRKEEIYRIIIGSSNMTLSAITKNREWNTKIVSTEYGQVAKDILQEFNQLWNDENSYSYQDIIETYRQEYLKKKLIEKQQKLALQSQVVELEQYKLKPNKMQIAFIDNLVKMISSGVGKALLLSSTGTGKTYASAFAMRELQYKKVLFIVHRNQIAKQALKSFRKVFGGSVSMGMLSGTLNRMEYDKDYIFATIQTLSKDENMRRFSPEHFDAIVYDEAHHTSADSYKKVMNYFKPQFSLGMTATPDKRDDNIDGKNIYEIFDHNIAYEIRLQQAMEEDLLCPFHYFGITDLEVVSDNKKKKENIENFGYLTSDERVENVIKWAKYYGYSGDRVKGLIFCSRVDEAKELSRKLNERGLRTIALSGADSEEVRAKAIERLAMDETNTNSEINTVQDMQPLDYILSVDVFSEGVDIVEVNQVIMLRPTQSPIVFIQQLGRGLRKAEGKEYVVVLDFIGNYTNNFMIPIALSGDRSYNQDTIRKYVISGNNTIPGASTIHFDRIAKEKIFNSIDKIKGIKSIIRESYISLKNRLGKVPYLIDFYENGEVDPLVIIREYKTYQNFLLSVESEQYCNKISSQELVTLEYLSKTILSGARPYELEILKKFLNQDVVYVDKINNEFKEKYGYEMDTASFESTINVLQGHFVSKDDEYKKYCHIDIVNYNKEHMILRMKNFSERLQHMEFYKQVNDIIEVGLKRYKDKYSLCQADERPFVLYEKYSRRDISLLMNCEKDFSSTMYGMKRIKDDVFIFVTYHKQQNIDDEKNYVDGKPDYADVFENNMIFRWDSQIGRGINSSYVSDVTNSARKHLLVKKCDAETGFYYMGQFDVIGIQSAKKKDNKGKEREITKFQMRMHHAVREDILKYLQSSILLKNN